MHPLGTATVRCPLFINQGEQREASHFLALATDLEKEGGGQVQLRIKESSTLFSHSQKTVLFWKKCIKHNAQSNMLVKIS